jgi:hypothetical protein
MMTTLEWSETEGGYTSGGYLITRTGTRQWSMEVDTSVKPPMRRRPRDDGRSFHSLGSARAAALHLEVVRVRRIKLIRHVTLSMVMFGMSVGFYLTMAAGSEANRLEWFTLSGVAIFAALSEGLDAFVLVVADGWDHRYEVPRLSIVDRVVSFTVISALWPRPEPVNTHEDMESVRTLT